MPDEDNKSAVRRFFQKVWNDGNVAEAASFLAPDFVSHNSFGVSAVGPQQYGQAVLGYRAAFPDLVTTVEDALADGNRVAVRGTDRGTHRGEFMGYQPTGRFVTTTWIEIFRFEAGMAVEGWVETNVKQLLDQLVDDRAD
jgi:predicted ester cyclase